jgi:hypothetical protein
LSAASPVKLVAQLCVAQVRPPSTERLTATAPAAGLKATNAK